MATKHSGNWKQSIFTGYRLRAVCGCAIDQWGGSEKPTDSKKEKNDMLAASFSAKLLILELIHLQYFFYYNTINTVFTTKHTLVKATLQDIQRKVPSCSLLCWCGIADWKNGNQPYLCSAPLVIYTTMAFFHFVEMFLCAVRYIT